MRKNLAVAATMLLAVVLSAAERETFSQATNATADGYRGIWYGGKEYGGGFALFPSQHSPSAIYRAEARKTFFVYGGTVAGRLQLQAMASYYDHERDVVPRPTIVHDWGKWNLKPGQAADGHRNPTLCVDGDGYVWVFVSGHADAGYVYRSKKPHSVEDFERIIATPMTYPNPWWIPNKGFFLFFTKYDHNRESFWTTSPDGKSFADPDTWKAPGQLNAWTVGQEGGQPGHGLYQFTAAHGSRVATAMNNWIGRTRDRSNLFYLQSDDMGRTWQTADGKDFSPPIREVKCRALVHDFWGERLQVYIQHMTFDRQGRPAILFLTSPAGQTKEGPGGPRTWTVAHWVGNRWVFHPVTTSSHNFDCGSLYIEDDGTWRIIGPTEPGPQLWRSGGEVAMWTSHDEGATWKKVKQLSTGSKHNHCYVRKPVDAHPDFYALWADGDGNNKSAPCQLYFCNKSGDVRVLPQTMIGSFAQPKTLSFSSTLNLEELTAARRLALEHILRLQDLDQGSPDYGSFWDAYYPEGKFHGDHKPRRGITHFCQPYMETAAFTLETLAEASSLPDGRRFLEAAILCVEEWFIRRIQFGKGRPETAGALAHHAGFGVLHTFDNGEAVRGSLAVYRKTGNLAHLKLAEQIAQWGITQRLRADGSMITSVNLSTGQVDASPAVFQGRGWGWSLLELWKETGKQEYRDAGEKVLRWVLGQQRPNGWLAQCEEYATYGAEGLYFGGKTLSNKEMVAAAKKFLDASIKAPHHPEGFLYFHYKPDWTPSVSHGFWSADGQHARLCYHFYRDTNDERYLKEGDRILHMLMKQQVRSSDNRMTIGAIPHAFGTGPWSTRLPIWTAKYFVDVITLRLLISSGATPGP